MALDDLHTWRIGQDGNCKEFDAAVHSHVDNLLSKHSILEPDEKNVKDLFRSLKGAHDGYQNAWKHAQAHGLDDPAVSPVEAAAAKEGWKLSLANLHAERNKVVRVLKAIWRPRAGEGRFDFGFCVCGEPGQEGVRLLFQWGDPSHHLEGLRLLIQCGECSCYHIELPTTTLLALHPFLATASILQRALRVFF